MIKKSITIVTLLLVCQLSFAQRSVDQLFNELTRAANTEGVKIGKFTMAIAGLFTETMGVDEIEAYSLSNCDQPTKEKLVNAIRNLKDPEFETMVTNNENGNRTRVLVKIKEDMIREMVVLTTGEESALVRIKGKIKPSDIERVANKHGNGN